MTSPEIEEKWRKRWDEARLFEAGPSDARKYFINAPYPYINGLLHLGHGMTYARVDIMARYKRIRGYNVLYPYAFHATGTPIGAAAARIADGEESQISILRSMEIPREDLPKFSDPIHWIEYFPGEAEADLRAISASVDWRRKFITTSLNPHYDAFIRWQFGKLKEKGLVAIGSHPVVWCEKDNWPVGDHARLEGEGEMPQEFTLLKFKLGEEFILAATLRPETVFGQTNLWVDPDVDYDRIAVNGEIWIVSDSCARKLIQQGWDAEVIGTVPGRDLIGLSAVAPVIHTEIPILPSTFTDPEKGTGIVTSVPSDAPDDWIALIDLKRDGSLITRYGMDPDALRTIEPIPIIRSEGWGEFPAGEIVEQMGIKDQNDREKLEEAKKVIYKSGFYTGVMRENCEQYAGMPVEEAKELVKREMLDNGEASSIYELASNVVCRCLTPCVVKVVSDQWFLAYGDPEWKASARKCLDEMDLFPETSRKQFDYVMGWLRDWACTRELGLGTRLPWDEKWVIESLSDSTIYMAYYTFAHRITEIAPDKLGDYLFDHLLLGTGDPGEVAEQAGVDASVIDDMRKEFEYWYPFDLRCSGKDLIQNHLAFCIFNHTGIFEERHWPRGFHVTGHIQVAGEKMSKSRGNFSNMRDLALKYGGDIMRTTYANGGEGLDDPNWDPDFADTIGGRLDSWAQFAVQNHGKGRKDELLIDRWFRAVIQKTIHDYCASMDRLNFRTGLKTSFFDLQRQYKWYMRRCEEPSAEVMKQYIESLTIMLSPFAPHLAEEIWERLGKEPFIAVEVLEVIDPDEIDEEALQGEEFLSSFMEDIREVLNLIGGQPREINIYSASLWKWTVARKVADSFTAGNANFNDIMKEVMADPELRKFGKAVPGTVKRLINERSSYELTPEQEWSVLETEVKFLEKEFGTPVKIWREGEGEDPIGKARSALPMKPALYVVSD